jgi:hypothetical protein
VAVTKKHNEVGDVFNFISSIINIVGASCKRMKVIREKQYARIIEGLENGEISSRRGLNKKILLEGMVIPVGAPIMLQLFVYL